MMRRGYKLTSILEKGCVALLIALGLLLAISFIPIGDGKKGISLQPAIYENGKISPEVREQISDAAGSGESGKISVVVKASEPTGREIEKIGGKILNYADSVDKKARYFAIEADAEKVAELAASEDVVSISRRTIFYAMLDESVPLVGAEAFWNGGHAGSGVKVAVLDTGIDGSHPMLSGKVVAERDFSNSGTAGDNHGHGTHVAGIIAGTKSNGGLYDGVAPEAQLINAKVLNDQGEGTIDSVIEGIGWAVDNGADVISMSLGAPSKLNADLDNEIKAAVERGVIVVVSSGNCGNGCPSYNCGSFRGVTMPGNSPNAISVGAVNKNRDVACFSSGENIAGIGIKPDVVAPGVNIRSSVPNSGYQSKDGTSMAAPHVSGAVALLLSKNPQLTQNDVKRILEKTSLDLGELGKDTNYGFGLIDLEKAVIYKEGLEFKIGLERQILVGAVQKITVTISDDIPINSVKGTITKPDGSKAGIDFAKTSNGYSYDYSDTSLAGNYMTDVAVNYGSAGASSDINTGNSNSGETSTSYYSTSFKAVSPTGEFGWIENVSIGERQFLSKNLTGSITFRNTATKELNVSILISLMNIGSEDEAAQGIRLPPITVAQNSVSAIPVNSVIEASPGNYALKILTDYGAGNIVNETNITVIDDLAPKILSIGYPETIGGKNPQQFIAKLEEPAGLSGAWLSLNDSAGSVVNNYTTHLIGRIGRETDVSVTVWKGLETGNSYTAQIAFCDLAGNCADSPAMSFNVSECQGRQLLVVKLQEERSSFEEAASSGGACLAVINRASSGTPPAAYLENFDGIVWTTATDLVNINDEDAAALTDYYNKKGRLIVEGSDVAFNRGNDEFMRSALHSELGNDLGFAVTSRNELNNLSINITRPHPLLRGLENPLHFNATTDPFPDAVDAYNGGAELAAWAGLDANGSAIIVYEYGNKKSLFLPFSVNALSEGERNIVALNSVEWLLDKSENDIKPTKVYHIIPPPQLPSSGNAYCTSMCVPQWQLSSNGCSFTDCGSACNSKGITAFETQSECELAASGGAGIPVEGQSFGLAALVESANRTDGKPVTEMLIDGLKADAVTKRSANNEYYSVSIINLSAGSHSVKVIANSDFAEGENNYLNNIKELNLTVYPEKPDFLFSGIDYRYNEGARAVTIDINISNMGGTEAAASVKVYLDNPEKAQQESELGLSPGETKQLRFELPLEKGAHGFKAAVDPDNLADEHNESNNELQETIYVCNKEKVLVVDDNDAEFYSTAEPSSAGEFASVLRDNGYCVSTWDEAAQGTPPLDFAETFHAVVWSAGDYFENVVNDADKELLRSYGKGFLVEGSDAAMDLEDGSLLESLSGATFSTDMLISETEELVLKNHPITESISSIKIANEKSPYPDGVEAVNAEVVAEWRDGSAAITANQNAERRTAHYAFSADAITDKPVREKLILNTVQWLLESQNRKPVANVTAGSSISISGITITMNEGETKNFSVVATDPDNDPLIYTWLLNGTIVSTTTEFTFAPGYDDSGTYNLTIIVSDGRLTDSAEFTVEVNNVNRAPVLAPLSNITANENETVSMMPTATDPDGDEIDFTFSQPLDESGVWRTTFNDAGTYTATVTASDGSLNDSGTVNITVLNVNRPPVIQIVLIEPPGSVMNEGETKSFFAAVSDADEDAIKYTWKVNGEVKAVSSPTFLFSTDYDDSGEYRIELIASDSDSASSTEIILTVQDTLSCGNGQTRPCALQAGACSGSFEACSDGVWLGCTASAYSRNNPAYLDREYWPFCSDGLDNDCNGKTDRQEEVCASLGESGPKLPPCGNYGDVDGDGMVTEADASLVSSYRSQLAELTAQQRERGDVDGNGEVTIVDAMLIAQYATGRIDTFKTCNQAKTACTDTDGGKDHFAKGTVTAIQDGIVRAGTDSCNSDGTLREWFCGEVGDAAGVFRSENYVPCLNGCNDGACIPS